MTDPYGDKPDLVSDAHAWHEMTFQISIDQEVDWQKVDLRKWSQTVAKFTALLMAKSTTEEDNEEDDDRVIKTLIMAVKVGRVTFVTDDDLHSLIDEFGDDTDE